MKRKFKKCKEKLKLYDLAFEMSFSARFQNLALIRLYTDVYDYPNLLLKKYTASSLS